MKSRTSRFATIVIATLAFVSPALAHEFKVGDIEIGHPYARAMLPGAKVGGGYLKLTNEGGTDDRLVSATSDRAGSIQLHEMKIDAGVMIMRELQGGIVIPKGQTIELKPGGYHVMFMNVQQAFKEGETVKATLTFEKAGSVEVEFSVGSPAGGAPEMKHDGHAKHGDHAAMQMPPQSADPQEAIPAKLKAAFATADKPLSVAPVVVQEDWAIAGWTQEGRGGRALLKKKGDVWSIHLCSGDGLKQATALKEMGLSDNDASALSAKLAEAEAHVDAKTLALFASFEGTVMVEGAEDHGGHDVHKDHGK
ncbi:copper uptake system-associated protein [Agrobacterium vitis]|uniref:Copper chaperone PCu(A)C n=1 Tax=Agrobacterium vitis TaxID=373 RepID=A0AAE2R9T2_AGRVI|nr:copper uptake system-associated protein [Agrobacterium vitis]MBF2714426.1 copper chaperone PCu(A)C [Agrobacterium vitis]MUZ64302.1 copper uptake system-associated protein [Agrobacterium vitis]MVA19019.1 copper uptake system-associated protein [Agrobacterium vitis]